MEKYSFFNDVNNDRVYFAEDFARHLACYFSNGIFNNGCQVVSNDNMTVSVKSGSANINGYRYDNDSIKILDIDNADGILNRIDNIVIRLDLTNRNITAQVVKGIPAQNAVAPDLVRNTTVYDLRIAKISIPANTPTITQDLITDTRFITSDCGDVISTIKTPDTEDLFVQIQSIFDNTISDMTDNFEKWFEVIKGQLGEDAAVALTLSLAELKEKVTSLETDNQNTKVSITTLNNNYQDLITNKQNKVLFGTTEPSTSLGVDGDVYLQYEE